MLKRYLPYLLFFTMLLSSCNKKESAKTLNLCFQQNPITIDPRKSGEQYSSTLIFLLYEGLMKSLPDGTVIPGMASRYKISEDGKRYTFYLRKGLWSDGANVTAHDFEYAFKSSLSHDFPSVNAQLFYPIKHAEAIAQKRLSSNMLGVKALDDYTLQVDLEKPTPYFLKLVCFCNFYPVPSHIAEKSNNWDKTFDHAITNGPYSLTSFSPYDRINLKKNSQYWDRENVEAERITIHIISDPETSLHLFEKKELDWIGAVLSPIPDYAMQEYKKREEFALLPKQGIIFITYNMNSFPFNNLNIRKAFSLVLDREEMEKINKGFLNVAAKRLLPEFLMAEQKELIHTISLEEARALFAQGVEELGQDIEEIHFNFHGSSNKDLCQYMQKIWESAFNIKVHIEQREFKSFIDQLNRKKYQAALYGSLAQIGDPIDILERYKYASYPKNYPGFEDPIYIELLEKSSYCDGKERTQLLEAAEKRMLELLPLAPLLHLQYCHLSHLENVIYSNSSGIRFEKARLKEAR